MLLPSIANNPFSCLENSVNIALVQLPHFYGNNMERLPESYPLGLGYISSVLAKADIPHQGVDLWAKRLSVPEALQQIDFNKFDFIGISAYSTQYKYLKSFSLGLKERYPHIPVICGGPGPTFSADIILRKTGVDVCVVGEGEAALLDLLANFKDLSKVSGIAFKHQDKIFRTPPRPYVTNLDEIPFPNRDLFDFESVIESANHIRAAADMPGLKKKPRRAADVIAGRGCPFQCFYCSKTFKGCRLRSIENIISEIRLLKEKYQIDHLQFNDELVVVSKERILRLCKGLKPFNMTFSCQGHISMVDRDILLAMKDAGCRQIGYGVESFSQAILDNMNKKLRAEKIIPVIKMTKDVGIEPMIQYMYGYRGENDRTLAETVRFFKEIDHPYIGFTVTPIPGSKLYQDCINEGRIQDEEDYLLRLDSGYNLDGAGINLSEFTDSELLKKKLSLRLRVTHNYFSKRPLAYIQLILNSLKRRWSRSFKLLNVYLKDRLRVGTPL